MTRLRRGLILGCGLTALLIVVQRHTPSHAAPQNPVAPQNTAPRTARIAVLGALPPLTDAKDAAATVAVLKRAGYSPTLIPGKQLADNRIFNGRDFDLLIVPRARIFPALAQPNLLQFLNNQGRLLCIGGPAFSQYAFPKGEEWELRKESPILPPILESLSPPHKGVFIGSEIAGSWQPIARHRGLGWMGHVPGRLLSADPRGEEEGYGRESRGKQWVYLALSRPTGKTLWGGTVKAEYPGEPTFTPLVPLVERMLQDVFLTQAGSGRVSHAAWEAVTVGALLVNVGKSPQSVSGEIEVRAVGSAPPVLNGLQPFNTRLQPNGQDVARFDFGTLPPGEYVVRTTLFRADGRQGDDRVVLDRITDHFRVLPKEPKAAKPGEFVRVKNGRFVLNGKPWRPVGLHYRPLWTSGQESSDLPESWLAPGQYDPMLVERDLEICSRLGINLLSVTTTRGDQLPGLADFVARCRNRRLKVNVIVADGNPLDFNAGAMMTFLDGSHLRGDPTVFALTFNCPLLPGKKAADYKSGLQRLMQTVQPKGVLVSARFVNAQGYAMKPPFDVQAVVGSLDFITWPCELVAYQKLPGPSLLSLKTSPPQGKAKSKKPLLLDGFGYPVNGASGAELRKQADVYARFLKQPVFKNAAGVVCWWFPGGLRLADNTDFGIIGADGVPRPAARILQGFAAQKQN